MYDHLTGTVVRASGTTAILHVNGLGFELRVPVRTGGSLQPEQAATLFTILHTNDGHPTLLGFGERPERDLARQLLAVSGVGPTMALAVLSTYAPDEIGSAIRQSDVAAMQKVKGVGKKTAERLCLELRDKIDKLDLGELAIAADPGAPADNSDVDARAEDAIGALITLGFAEADARKKAMKQLADQPELSTEQLVKAVLRS
ncbi:MAG: Holliday junction branch migration protein RuvA [Planctomycetota bacterium]